MGYVYVGDVWRNVVPVHISAETLALLSSTKVCTKQARRSRGPKASMPSPERKREPVKVRRLRDNLYRVADLNGQGSQYLRANELPRAVRANADRDGAAYAEASMRADCRWAVKLPRRRVAA